MRHGDLPPDLVHQRTTPDFTSETVPVGLTRAHRIALEVWGLLEVTSGELTFVWEGKDEPVILSAGDSLVIPPDTPHHVELGTGARFRVSFYR